MLVKNQNPIDNQRDTIPLGELTQMAVKTMFPDNKDDRIKYLENELAVIRKFTQELLKYVDVEEFLSDMGIQRDSQDWRDYSEAKRLIADFWFDSNVYDDFIRKVLDYLGL